MKINKFVITIFFSAVGLFASTALWAQAKTLFVNMPFSKPVTNQSKPGRLY